MRFNAEDTMAIFVDYQEKLMPVIEDKDEIIKKSAMLAKGLKALGVPFIVSQQYTKGLGETVQPMKEAFGEFEPFDKTSFSCYENEDMKASIEALGKQNIIICGAEAHICVLQTVMDLRAAGYNVAFVVDCVGSRKAFDKKFGTKRAVEEGAFLTTSEAVLFELTRGSFSPAFKEISKLVK